LSSIAVEAIVKQGTQMRVLVLADIDEFQWKHGPGHANAVLSCGDVADGVILEAAQSHGCLAIYAVKGNHDGRGAFPHTIENLHLTICEFWGLRLGGLQGAWRYKPVGNFLYDQEEIVELLGTMPPVDILVCHNSPRKVHDKEDEVHYGFDGLNEYIERAKPKLLIHGHQHVNKETLVGQTRVVGVYGHKVIEV
jgi:Icc-related predicted phosphoesterase